VTNRVTVFDNSNGGTVENGGTAPTFNTGGKAYCVVLLQTYHWNGGKGASHGTLGLKRVGGAGPGGIGSLGPYKASASPGQNNAPNVNWYVYVQPPGAAPQVIDGTYTCEDSGAATWSTASKGGPGFCMVYGVPAAATASSSSTASTTTKTKTKCPTTGVFPPRCRYDLHVAISGPSEIAGGTAPQRINFTVTVSNEGRVSSPRLPRDYLDGLVFGFIEATWRQGDSSSYERMHLSKVSPACAPADSIAACSVQALAPEEHESFAFTVLWNAADKRMFEEWSTSHPPLERFFIRVPVNVNHGACGDEETTCANNYVNGKDGKEVGVVTSLP
jgi:hypothetical protein